MEEKTTISAVEFCRHHQIEITFIQSLHEYGLVHIETDTNEDWLLPREQLDQLERMVRLHYDLHINMEGLDAITNLLQQVEGLQREVLSLRSRLKLYGGE